MNEYGAKGSTVPEELQRQSDRINTQLNNLDNILNVVTDHLSEMSTIMDKYSPRLVSQINDLTSYLDTYKTKAKEIYGEVADSLSNYANNLLYNIDDLIGNVEKIGNSIENL